MHLNGIHHVTAVSAQIGRNLDFYTRVLGLRLVKKSVNQDDTSAYHLFYADKLGSPGTDMTFFDWPRIGQERRGTDSISATVFRVNGEDALRYWSIRLRKHGVTPSEIEQFDGRALLRFDDPEGQRLALMDDGGAVFEGEVWDGADVPDAYALRGFYAAMLSTPHLPHLAPILTQLLNFEAVGRRAWPAKDNTEVTVYALNGGGPGREVWVAEEPALPPAYPGAGGVHHVAFRVADVDEQRAWRQRLTSVGLPVSNLIDRYYFSSIYFRVSNGILFEIATDGPGFATDEDPATLGQRLALPPFLEPRRAEIEAGL
ncbi:MAG: ring-cleaving dioxygenase, partial [Caldilineaceae bacterium]|nr:ring-cleaving dioxygenase [Caldilineaceae bacterium]